AHQGIHRAPHGRGHGDGPLRAGRRRRHSRQPPHGGRRAGDGGVGSAGVRAFAGGHRLADARVRSTRRRAAGERGVPAARRRLARSHDARVGFAPRRTLLHRGDRTGSVRVRVRRRPRAPRRPVQARRATRRRPAVRDVGAGPGLPPPARRRRAPPSAGRPVRRRQEPDLRQAGGRRRAPWRRCRSPGGHDRRPARGRDGAARRFRPRAQRAAGRRARPRGGRGGGGAARRAPVRPDRHRRLRSLRPGSSRGAARVGAGERCRHRRRAAGGPGCAGVRRLGPRLRRAGRAPPAADPAGRRAALGRRGGRRGRWPFADGGRHRARRGGRPHPPFTRMARAAARTGLVRAAGGVFV
ncbi:MAG: hypothetical protein AVDCRST_MAG08-1715, partial [uncultured Acetobacteraceae bacterium]